MPGPTANMPVESEAGAAGGCVGDKTWASVLGRGLVPAKDNNVLEVVLEKDVRGGFSVTDIECCNLIRRLGLDPRPGVQVEGVQICPNGRGVIFITLKQGIEIGKYCRYDVLEVTSSGIRASLVKPAGKREVVVTLKGLHPNTSDNTVLDYLSKFARIVTRKVVYGVFTEGPLKGMRNGDRNFKMEIKPNSNLGSFHVLDGHRVTLKYPGQQQTCARCFQTAQYCRGKGIARRCEAEGGNRGDFNTYILKLWRNIGYSPKSEAFEEDVNTEITNQENLESESFTPRKSQTDPQKYKGVSIKNIPKDTDHGDIVEFLILSGLPEEKKDNININSNGSVTVWNLGSETCSALISSIHSRNHFGKKLYCNGYIPLTPEKADLSPEDSSAPKSPCPGLVTPCSPSAATGAKKNAEILACQPTQVPEKPVGEPLPPPAQPVPQVTCSSPKSLLESSLSKYDWNEETDEKVVRRHSLSLMRRTPPKDSLAAEILGTNNFQAKNKETHMSKSIMDSIRDMQEVLSDFNSCQSTLDDSTSSSNESSDDLKNPKQSNNGRKAKKRKARAEFSRGDFLKKQDTKLSPNK